MDQPHWLHVTVTLKTGPELHIFSDEIYVATGPGKGRRNSIERVMARLDWLEHRGPEHAKFRKHRSEFERADVGRPALHQAEELFPRWLDLQREMLENAQFEPVNGQRDPSDWGVTRQLAFEVDPKGFDRNPDKATHRVWEIVKPHVQAVKKPSA